MTKKSKPAKKTAAKKATKKPAKAAAAKPAPAPKALKAPKVVSISAKELETIRQRLTDQRRDVIEAMKRNRAPEVTSDTGDEADQAQAAMDRDLQFELSDTERNTLDQIEGAIRKIDKGTYGACEQCRQPIETLRIKALPFARYCIRCQSGSERAVTATQA
ncbi:MAG: DnaK suppressor protein [Elusimicrobia bacterium]|nr:MAG: DnaK suppressor protein [Elusimicrobiota bacterium]